MIMTISAKQALSAIGYAMTDTRLNASVAPKHTEALLIALADLPKYAKLCEQVKLGEAEFAISMMPFGPRKLRSLVIRRPGKPSIAITKSAVQCAIANGEAKPRSRKACAYCGSTKGCAKGEVLSAMRGLIAYQIAEFKQGVKRRIAELYADGSAGAAAEAMRLSKCALSNKPLHLAKVHVDHVYPFSKLSLDWANEQKLVLCQQKLAGRGLIKVFASNKLNESWKTYHAKHAQLQLTSAKSNMQKGAKL